VSAYISDDGLYRYTLTRDLGLSNADVCCFVMLNPSTAGATANDPTIRRCMRFAGDWGYGLLSVVNLYAFRTTDPDYLWLQHDPVGPENDEMLATAFYVSDLVIAAWGANARRERVAEVMALPFAPRWALGLTKRGVPRHPLYMRADCDLIPYGQALASTRTALPSPESGPAGGSVGEEQT
jgi:hypothetical protein